MRVPVGNDDERKHGFLNARYASPFRRKRTSGNGSAAGFDGCRILAAKFLLAQAEFADDALVTLGIVFLEVVEQAATLADQHEKTAARTVIFLVRFEVLRQLANALA